ncbi:MAG: 50S ribosomal protein L21, partial [Deltaproteobacteria bacterium]|nr:50S ribosomal protein L21 [Deltaproteobacteria bacterium]
MYAVIKTGGKQYSVTPGEEVKLEKLEGGVGDMVTFEEVLLTSDDEDIRVGKPYLEGAKVVGRIIRQGKDRKIVVLK